MEKKFCHAQRRQGFFKVDRQVYMIPQEYFDNALKEFEQLEKRGSFYPMFLNLIKNGFEIEAYLFILSTWNFARFRYAVREFDIEGFKETIRRLDRVFGKLENKDFQTIDFESYKSGISKIYGTLSSIKGIEHTGASKIMHLRLPKVFVMWDDYISGRKPKKYYENLEITRRGYWSFKRYGRNSKGYIGFLKDMQERFKGIKCPAGKTLPKAIDEFNYVKITLEIQRAMKK